ncbi:ABC transporter substrate-binding protein [Sinorhizobium meliloti]|uniref:ABC transporter substrate-binding protein n=1 Tax=Rhizobium meliloti TaxID=382 RepID=UPI000FD88983|nr:ABC transporter substrate-binding protein [Sinorhizobium meliloti]MDW9476746.1 extracellular solute-binding protein [Sinorhizobium meliloti]MDW9682372.1 extracellular solute-binding protein [Sinorhizobium meliloti]MDW9695489.1 extracellular solute-binding protein [Sinorhizobium meliloti]MDW9720355.1 extracellular solute-binding protein [Sinorhizobium meliloti]MDW9757573.1 extracellular solute-binding protein [Sinorhizobium meliloti]
MSYSLGNSLRRRQVLLGGLGFAAMPILGKFAAASEGSLRFIGWDFEPSIVQRNVNTFMKLYNDNVSYELVSGDYPSMVETRLTGGQHVDMLYAEDNCIARWHTAGWIRDIDALAGAAEIKQQMYPVSAESLSLPGGGPLCGLPYYAGHNAFLFNEEHLKKIGSPSLDAWDDVLEACRKLKKDGISDAPFHAMWQQSWPNMSWYMFAAWYSEGATVFDGDGNLVDEPALRRILEINQTFYQEKLVTPDIMTLPGEGVTSYASGRHTFMVVHDYNQKIFNDPAVSKIAGKVRNAMMPGASHSTMAWTAAYLMGSQPVDEERAWNLLQFFGGKAQDGQYHVIKRWALDFGLGSAYKEVMEDPEVVSSFSRWRDIAVSAKQLELSRSRQIGKAIWFSEWDTYMMQQVQEYIRTGSSTDQLVENLIAKASDLKKQYQ